jgi:hypothetical protein
VTELLSHGADVNALTHSGHTALSLAVDRKSPAVARVLREHGADREQRAFPAMTGPCFGLPSPGSVPRLFGPDIVATPYDQHGNVTISPAGDEILWAGGLDKPDSGYGYSTILYSRIENGHWTPPRMAPFASRRQGDDVPFFAPDGGRLFFMSARPLTPGQPGGKENIWVVVRQVDGWGVPRPLPQIVNRFEHHWQISVASSGNLYFSSRDGPPETAGIYVSRCVDGEFTEPRFLGFAGSTPYVAPDESYLITLDSMPQGRHNFIRFRQADGTWGQPLDITLATGGAVAGICPMVSPDERFFFFLGNVTGANNTFWVEADFIAELRPHRARD